MLWIDIVFALLVGLLFSLLLVPVGRRRGPGPLSGSFFFFILLFLIAWSGGIWLSPAEAGWTGAWPGFFAVGLIAALLIAALIPPHSTYTVDARTKEQKAEEDAEATVAAEAGIAVFGLFTWLLLFALLGIIIAHYVMIT